MAKALFIAEKSSLRKSVEAAYQKHRSEFADEIIFSEMSGHLVTLKLPSEIEPNLSHDWSSIPFLPEEHGGWQYKVIEEKNSKYRVTAKDRFDIIKDLLDKNNFDYIIHAGDSDQEGELLVNLLLSYLHNTLPVKRYWANTTVEAEIVDALKNLRNEASDTMLINLLKAGYARQHTDYRFGMNLSSAGSIQMSGRAAIGRVKTVMLHIVCQREEAIRNFTPSTSYGVKVLYTCGAEGVLHDNTSGADKDDDESSGIVLFDEKKDAQSWISSLAGKNGVVLTYDVSKTETKPPRLFKMSRAQVRAGKLGYSTEETAETIQHLYEMGFMSYPRTSCDLLGSGENFRALLDSAAVLPELEPFVQMITDTDIERVKKDKRWVNNKAIKEEGHTALCPTVNHVDLSALSPKERDIYTMICKQFVSIFLPPVVQEKTRMTVDIDGSMFVSTGKKLLNAGYSKIFGTTYTDTLIPLMAVGDTIDVSGYDITEHTTSCPSHLTDTDLVGLCESPAKYLEDLSLKSLGKRLHIGTDATRTEVIKTLVNKDKYLEFKKLGKKEYLSPTAVGLALDENLCTCSITKVDVTGHLEEKLDMVRHGTLSFDDMEKESVNVMMQMLDEIKNATMKPLPGGQNAPIGVCPKCGKSVISGKKVYFCTGYNDGCDFVIGKMLLGASITEKDVKSLLDGKEIMKKLEKDGRKWEQGLKLGSDSKLEFVKNVRKESSYICPLCGGKLMESNKNFLCSNYRHDDENSCHFCVPKEVCGVTLLDADIQSLMQTGKTRLIKGFVSKSKKTFDAMLKLTDGEVKFAFPEPEKSGLACPECGSELMNTQYGYVCPNHKKDDPNSCRFSGIAHVIAGKKIDESLVKRLLSDKKTSQLSGFKSKNGKSFSACLVLTDGNVKFEFDQGAAPTVSSFHCPCCGMALMENNLNFKCNCGFSLWKTIAKKKLSETEIREILTNGSTSGPVYGFKSSKGKQKAFNARLYVDKAEKTVKFDFS